MARSIKCLSAGRGAVTSFGTLLAPSFSLKLPPPPNLGTRQSQEPFKSKAAQRSSIYFRSSKFADGKQSVPGEFMAPDGAGRLVRTACLVGSLLKSVGWAVGGLSSTLHPL